MFKFDEHCAESIRLFGKPFEELHHCPDEFVGTSLFDGENIRKGCSGQRRKHEV
jgi:hypothetical protein